MDGSDVETSVQASQTASVDQQASQPQRSRTTVVCAECKRLKLKCDRDQPCGSCVKRNSIPKCLYSAGAAEKVDVHSLNHRLTHIETFTTTYTNGRFHPAYASANHPSSEANNAHPNYTCQSNQQHPGWYHHQHHHHAAILNPAFMAETFSKAFQNIVPTCLADLEIVRTGDIKLEPASGFLDSSPSSFRRMSKSQLRQLLRSRRIDADRTLPSMTVYFPTSIASPLEAQNNVPQPTPTLLACLPPFATCQRLLRSAGDIFRVRPLPFDPSCGSGQGWNRLEKKCLQLVGNVGKGSDEKKSVALKRARQIYLAGSSEHLLSDSVSDVRGGFGSRTNEGDGGHRFSLTFFAMTCAALAIGAISTTSDDRSLVPSSAAYFYALSQQALGVWSTHVSSSPSKQSKDDTEQIEFLLACLMNTVYLLLSGTVAAASTDESEGNVQQDDMEVGEGLQDDDAQIVSSLVGKMVTSARNMQLDKEAYFSKRKRKRSSSRDRLRDEWKRMVWWEIVFYDTFTADALGQQPLISLNQLSTSFPSCALFSDVEKPVSQEDPQLSDQVHAAQNEALVFRPTDAINDEGIYFGARYQLARVAQAVKSRNSQSDCCCGYTLDQAIALENQVMDWQVALPTCLKVSGDEEPTPASNLDVEAILKRIRAYELAITASVLVVDIYMPFLRADGNESKKSFKNLPAASACIHAAQAIIRLTNELQSLFSSPSSASKLLPLMFDFIPFERLVFGAVVVCAHAAFAVKSPSMTFRTSTMAEDAFDGLKLLQKLGPPLFPSVVERDDDEEFQNRVLNILHVRLVQRSGRLKRKLDDFTPGEAHQDLAQPMSGPPIFDKEAQSAPVTQHTFIMEPLSSPPSTRDPDLINNTRQSNRPKGKGRTGDTKVGCRRRQAPRRDPPLCSNRSPLFKSVEAWAKENQIDQPSTYFPLIDAQTVPLISPTASSGDSLTSTGHRSRSSSTSLAHLPPINTSLSLSFTTQIEQSPDQIGMPSRKRLVVQDLRESQFACHHEYDSSRHDDEQARDYPQVVQPGYEGQCPTGNMNPASYGMTQSPYGPQMSYFASSPYESYPASTNVIGLQTPVPSTSAATMMDVRPPLMSLPSTPVYEQSSQQPVQSYRSHAQVLHQHQIENHSMVSNSYHGVSDHHQSSMYDCSMVDPTAPGLLGW